MLFSKKISPLALLIGTALFSTTTFAEDDSIFAQWAPEGVTVESAVTADFVYNLSGGIKESNGQLINFDFIATFDTEAMGWWKNGTFNAYVLGVAGDNPTEFIGDFQTSTNIESASALRMYEFWYQHQLNENTSVLFGLHDYNSTFEVLEFSGVFLNSSFGISPDISQVGPSIFSVTGLGALLEVSFAKNAYFKVAAYDGVPGSESSEHGTHINLSSDDGIFYASEVGLLSEQNRYYKLAAGGWFKTTDFEDDIDGSSHSDNSGFYFIGEYAINDDLGVFFQLGFADENKNIVESYQGIGLSRQNLFQDGDQFGLAFNQANNSDGYHQANAGSSRSEQVLEVTYSIPVNDWLILKPDLQFIKNPGMDKSLNDATVFTLRTEITL
jgi:porin